MGLKVCSSCLSPRPLERVFLDAESCEHQSLTRSCIHAHMQEDFDAAAERIKTVEGPNNDEMLELYGLFKQATVGDNNTREYQQQRPSRGD